jgi:hypothetical protein
MIGYFDSEMNCQEVIRNLLPKPGYRDYPDSFYTIEDRIPDIQGGNIPNTVYEVTSERIINITDSYVSFLGVYAYEASAQNRVAKCKKRISKSKKETVFYIEPYTINKVHWSEGFDREG